MGAPTVTASPPSHPRVRRRTWWHAPHYSLAGIASALVFACASFTPSLLPRDWVLQGLVAGVSASFGYGLGAFLAWAVRRVLGWTPSPLVVQRLWVCLGLVGGPLLAWALWAGQRWQREIHLLTGLPAPTSYAWLRILILTVAVVFAVVAALRALRWLVRTLTVRLTRLVPRRVAAPLAVLIVVVGLVGLNDAVIRREAVHAVDSGFAAVNQTTSPGTVRPLLPERSGSPASLVPWNSLGMLGRDFVGRAPSVGQLSAFSGRPAEPPVRVYVGIRSASTPRQRADLAVRELRRAGGFDRAVLVVATTTGRGQVEPAAADAIEYMYNGDTAIVGMQYSYLPSWVSFVIDRYRAQQAGRLLFDAVYRAWRQLPPEHRPKLLVTGTSLGAFGGEGAFSGLSDIRRRTDGVVWAGPPYSSRIHLYLVQHRDPGSPERLPVYQDGRTVRFASTPADLTHPRAPWPRPRVVYLQNGSDPIVVWTPRLLFDKPDWLAEPRAPDVSPDMVWLPIVTFWQVTADLPFALDVPPGHGHDYREMFADAWAAVCPPPGWTAADTARLHARLRTMRY